LWLCPKPRGLSLCGQNTWGVLGEAEVCCASRPPIRVPAPA